MKIAYFHRLNFEETEERFKEEAQKMGITLTFIKYKDLVLESDSSPQCHSDPDLSGEESRYSNSTTDGSFVGSHDDGKIKITYQNQDIKNFDIWYFRSVGSELEWSKLLQHYAKYHNIPVVDEYLLTEGPLKRFKSVMGEMLHHAGINYPKTVYLNTFKQVREFVETRDGRREERFDFPFIVKMSSGGRHGMGTFFIRNEDSLAQLKQELQKRKDFAQKEGKAVPVFRGFLIQEYIPNDGDFRVVTVGYKCVGGFKRAPKEEKLVLNKSKEKSQGLQTIPEDVVRVAEEAARVLQIEVAGTDLVRSRTDSKVYIVEVNEAPQFSVFEKRTKINFPKIVLEYLINKVGTRV